MTGTEVLAYTDSKITELEDIVAGQKKLLSEYENALNGERAKCAKLKLELKVYKKALKLAVTDTRERCTLLDKVRGE